MPKPFYLNFRTAYLYVNNHLVLSTRNLKRLFMSIMEVREKMSIKL